MDDHPVSLLTSLNAALAEVLPSLQERDRAAVELARTLAARIDAESDDLAKLAPQYAAVLDALLMTPRARAAAAGKRATTNAPQRNALDDLRDRRARRNGTEAVDPAAS